MKIAVYIFLLAGSISVNAQPRAATFQAAAKNGLMVEVLDKQYMNALDNDNSKSVFKGNDQKKFYDAYVSMLTDLSAYLHANNFTWGKPTRIVHRIYFEADGKIDHYLLNLKSVNMDAAKKTRLLQLLNQFTNHYKFKITAAKKFAQCGPAVYQD